MGVTSTALLQYGHLGTNETGINMRASNINKKKLYKRIRPAGVIIGSAKIPMKKRITLALAYNRKVKQTLMITG
jgi:hypothetical protein